MQKHSLTFLIALLSPALAWADGDEDLGQSYLAAVAGGGVVTAGVGLSGRFDGVRNMSGDLIVSGIPAGATVEKAFLYWSVWLAPDSDPTFAGQVLAGQLIGISADTAWDALAKNYAYRSDVTALVTQNGTYTITGLQSSPLNGDVNGAGLIVVYSDPTRTESATIAVMDGARTWCGAGAFNEQFTNLAFPEQPSSATFGVHVADGQSASGATQLPDSSLTFGIASFSSTFDAADGGMWDRDTHDVSAVINTLPSQVWSYENDGLDCVQFVAAYLDARWPDADADLVSDANDNCPQVPNPAQDDADTNGIGDACEGAADMGSTDMGPADMGIDMAESPDMAVAADMGHDLPSDVGLDPADMAVDAATPDGGAPDSGRTEDVGTPESDGATSDLGPGTKVVSEDGCCATVQRGHESPWWAIALLAGLVAVRRRSIR